MRRALLIALLLVVAGCQAPALSPEETPALSNPDPAPTPSTDRLGWENGYWHNDSLAVSPGDGLNESEREAVVSRAMARVEYVRGLEFEESVSVDVIGRDAYRANRSGNHSAALERFDNAKFRALFLIGDEEDSIDVQEETRGETVLGYYSPGRDAIVLVSESETPTIEGEEVLAHELVHALQDQHFDLANGSVDTRDAYQGRNGIVEGDASYVQHRYMDRCGEAWRCLDPESAGSGGGGGGGDVHAGISFLEYFPYSDGPGFVRALREAGGWEAVDAAYREVPDGASEVIHHERHYPAWEPAAVSLRDRSTGAWERVRPPNRPDYGVLGQSAIVAAQAYTLADEFNDSAVVSPRDVLNVDADGGLDRTDPYRYDTAAAAGWAGGRFHAFSGPDDALAYVWRTRWESRTEAREFAEGWQSTIEHWGGDHAGGDAWVIQDGGFEGAYAVRTNGPTVTVVHAPTRAALSAVHGD